MDKLWQNTFWFCIDFFTLIFFLVGPLKWPRLPSGILHVWAFSAQVWNTKVVWVWSGTFFKRDRMTWIDLFQNDIPGQLTYLTAVQIQNRSNFWLRQNMSCKICFTLLEIQAWVRISAPIKLILEVCHF